MDVEPEFIQISRLSYVFFNHVFFSHTRYQIVLIAIVVNLVCTYLTRGVGDSVDKNISWGGGGGGGGELLGIPDGAIYQQYLALYHTAWSTQKGMSRD